MRDHASLRRGRLSVAAIPSVASRLLPELVAAFMQRFPGIDMQMIELSSQDVERCVASGNADFGIAPAPERNSELSFSEAASAAAREFAGAMRERIGTVRWLIRNLWRRTQRLRGGGLEAP